MRTLQEKLRYILLTGKIVREGDEWVYTSHPDCDYVVMRDKSRWHLVEAIYDFKKGIKIWQ
jgi:hypothetical protein